MRVTMLGEGAWGMAMASLLADNGHEVTLWCVHEDSAAEIAQQRTNSRYMPGIQFSENIFPTTSLEDALEQSSYIFCAIPVSFLRVLVHSIVQISPDRSLIWILLSKGIEQKTMQVPSQIFASLLTREHRYAVLSGPSFARDLLNKHITGVMVAVQERVLYDSISSLVVNAYFKTFFSTDIIGVQWAAAYKNIIALAMGILSGAPHGDNTRAFLLVRMMHELQEILIWTGAQEQTVYTLAGLGDIVLTGYGAESRNVLVGQAIGAGKKLSDIIKNNMITAEGVNTVKSLYEFMEVSGKYWPFVHAINHIIFHSAPLDSLIQLL